MAYELEHLASELWRQETSCIIHDEHDRQLARMRVTELVSAIEHDTQWPVEARSATLREVEAGAVSDWVAGTTAAAARRLS